MLPSNDWGRIAKAMIRAHPWCVQCGHTGSEGNPLTVDHVVPKAKGGTDERANLQVLCSRHNSQKGGR